MKEQGKLSIWQDLENTLNKWFENSKYKHNKEMSVWVLGEMGLFVPSTDQMHPTYIYLILPEIKHKPVSHSSDVRSSRVQFGFWFISGSCLSASRLPMNQNHWDVNRNEYMKDIVFLWTCKTPRGRWWKPKVEKHCMK